MTVYRANYGDALYGQDTYGLSGSIVDAAASITPSCSVAVSAVKVFEGASYEVNHPQGGKNTLKLTLHSRVYLCSW